MDKNDHAAVCPNCGYHTSENYCARCGQETHLHADTVRGLVVHFTHHLIHYDSKFWKTLKALWFNPGELTIAYWKQQRMRYLSPISLYIFLSAVFFVASSLFGSEAESPKHNTETIRTTAAAPADSAGADAATRLLNLATKRLQEKAVRNQGSGHDIGDEAVEKLGHTAPKVFFFMIPFMAVILRGLFLRRQGLKLVHHMIFSLHIHAFWFSALTLIMLYVFDTGSGIFSFVVISAGLAYTTTAIKRTYNVGWPRSIATSLLTGFLYCAVLFLTMIALLAYFVLA